jgi:hypothetical protein
MIKPFGSCSRPVWKLCDAIFVTKAVLGALEVSVEDATVFCNTVQEHLPRLDQASSTLAEPFSRPITTSHSSMSTETYTETSPPANHALSIALDIDQISTTVDGQMNEGKSDRYQGYDNVHWYVGNAKQAATYFITRMGFKRVAYRGLETGSKAVASHVVRNGDVTFVLTSPMYAPNATVANCSVEDRQLLDEIHEHLRQHGDAVRDVAFQVDDVDAVYDSAIANGAHSVYAPKELTDEFGSAKYARIRTYGDTTHTLIQRDDYHGVFLPGFRAVEEDDKTAKFLPAVNLMHIDHCVGNQDWDQMEAACE